MLGAKHNNDHREYDVLYDYRNGRTAATAASTGPTSLDGLDVSQQKNCNQKRMGNACEYIILN